MEVIYHDKPFKIKKFPLTEMHVIDDWASPELLYNFNNITRRTIWAQNNQVNRAGRIQHLFWGATFYEGADKKARSCDNESDTYLVRYIDRKLQTDFGFRWVEFQYAGMNGQTLGLQGTVHEDCPFSNDQNISFLWYNTPYWEDKWGGSLCLYSEEAKELSGFKNIREELEQYKICEVPYKPNRLLMFDGRIPHNANAPEYTSYQCRQSIVIRGDKVRLENEMDRYADPRI